MKINSLYLGLVACLLIGGVARADQTYTYTIDLPSISGGAEVDSNFTQYAFSWVGPLMFNAAPNTACPTVCGPVTGGETVEDGYSFTGFDFTADLALSDAEAQINFSEDADPSNTITFSFIEPDSFWEAQGNDISFTGLDGAGASFAIGGTDPVCTGCTVSIAAVTTTPEPRSSILLAALLGGFGLAVRRRRRQSKTIS
jgi:MYXO-CTERM domain-containing protein